MALGCVRGESDIVEAFGIVVVGGVSSEGGVVVLSAVSVGMVGEGVVGMVGVVGFAMLAAFGVVMVGVEVGERVGEGGFAMLSAVGVVVVGVGVEEVVGEGGFAMLEAAGFVMVGVGVSEEVGEGGFAMLALVLSRGLDVLVAARRNLPYLAHIGRGLQGRSSLLMGVVVVVIVGWVGRVVVGGVVGASITSCQ